MSEDNNHLSEDELRKSIRAEIEQRDLERVKSQRRKESQRLASQQAEMKRKLYREEMERYYRDKPDYAQIIGDDGEPEWILKSEMNDADRLFDTIHDDPVKGKKAQKFIVVGLVIAFLALAVAVYFILYEGVGKIAVTSNIEGAQIILDAAPTVYYTNHILVKISAGEHIITVDKEGYKIAGNPIVQIDLKRGTTQKVHFELEPAPPADDGEQE